MLMATNGHEMIFEKLGTIENGTVCYLPVDKLEAARKADMFPCKITQTAIQEHVLPLLKAFRTKSNSRFCLVDFVPDPAKKCHAVIKANIFGRDIDIPVIYITEDNNSGLVMLWRSMVARDMTMKGANDFLLSKSLSSIVSMPAMTDITAWFARHTDPKPTGMIIQPWDIRDTDKKLRPNHVLIWPAHEDSIETSPYGVVSMQMRLKETCQGGEE